MVPEQNIEELEDLALFISELKGQISMIDRGVKTLRDESRAKVDKGIDQMRIAAHTIKGSARTFGFHPIAKLGQILEQTFLQIKDGNLLFNPPSLEEFTKAGLQALQILEQDLSNHKKESINVDEHIEKMKQILTQVPQVTNKETPDQFKEKKLARILEEASHRGLRVYEIIASSASDADTIAVSALQLKKKLEVSGKVAYSSTLNIGGSLQNNGFLMIFVTHENDTFIKTQASAISQVRSCRCSLLNANKLSVVTPIEVVPSSQSAAQNSIIIQIQLKENAFASSVRVLQILKTLKKMGEVIHSSPTEEELGNQRKVSTISICFKTNKSQDVVKQSLLNSVMDIENIQIQEEQKQNGLEAKNSLPGTIDPSLLPKLLRLANQLRERSDKLRTLKDESSQFGDTMFASRLAVTTEEIESLTGEFRQEIRGIVLGGILNTVEALPEQCLDLCDSLRKELSAASAKGASVEAGAIEKLTCFVGSLEQLLSELNNI